MIFLSSLASCDYQNVCHASFAFLFRYLSGGFGWISALLVVFCLLHALFTRQSLWWYLLLILLPPFSALLYIFMVLFKGAGEGTQVSQAGQGSSALRQRIASLEAQLAETDTIALKSELGQCWLELKKFAQAKEYFDKCLVGNFQNDPLLLYQLSQALYGTNEKEKALESLEKTFRDDYQDNLSERLYLQAKILGDLERPREALEIYNKIAQNFSTPEFFCRQALLYDKLGDVEKANVFYMLVLRAKNTLSDEELRESKKWLAMAAANIS